VGNGKNSTAANEGRFRRKRGAGGGLYERKKGEMNGLSGRRAKTEVGGTGDKNIELPHGDTICKKEEKRGETNLQYRLHFRTQHLLYKEQN